jgi:hypothetical protein
MDVSKHRVIPMLEDLGSTGLYLAVDDLEDAEELEALYASVEPYR